MSSTSKIESSTSKIESSTSKIDQFHKRYNDLQGAVGFTSAICGMGRSILTGNVAGFEGDSRFGDTIYVVGSLFDLLKDCVDSKKQLPLSLRLYSISNHIKSLCFNSAGIVYQIGLRSSGSMEAAPIIIAATAAVLVAGIVAGIAGIVFESIMIHELSEIQKDVSNLGKWKDLLTDQGCMSNGSISNNDKLNETINRYKKNRIRSVYTLMAGAVLTSSVFADTHINIRGIDVDAAVFVGNAMFLPPLLYDSFEVLKKLLRKQG